MSRKREGFRSDIAGLRAFAVMLVLASHFGVPGFHFGFIGVDIFFVISGYLITRILYREYLLSNDQKTSDQFISLANFYLRRIRRLVPAALTVILIANLVSFFLINSESRNNLIVDSKWALLFLANVSFLRSESNYFQLNTEPSMLQHYWSLSVEEQFYFIWPLLFLIAAHYRKARIFRRYFRFNHRLLVLIFLTSVFSFLFLQFGFQTAPKQVYFSIFSRAWELGIGGLAGILAFQKDRHLLFSRIERYLPLSFTVLICSLMISSSNWALFIPLPVISTAFFLYAGETEIKNGFNGNKPLKLIGKWILYIGEISYSLYLIHWPVYIILSRYSLHLQLLQIATSFLLSFVGANLLWKYVEMPFQRIPLPKKGIWDKKIFVFVTTRKPLLVFLSCSIIGSLYLVTYPGTSSTIFKTDLAIAGLRNDPNLLNYAQYEKQLIATNQPSVQDSNSSSTIANASAETSSPAPSTTAAFDFKSWQAESVSAIKAGLQKTKLDTQEISSFKTIKFDMSPFEKSICASTDSEIPPNCITGKYSAGKKRVALIGDSKMAHLAQPFIDYFSAKGWVVEPMVFAGCHMSNPVNDFQKNCIKRSKWVVSKIAAEKYDLVISAEYPSLNVDPTIQQNYYTRIQQNTKKLVIFEQVPSVPNTVDCIKSNYDIPALCLTPVQDEMITWQKMHSVFQNYAGGKLDLFDSGSWSCFNFQCPVTVEQTFVLRDGKHFTYSFIRKITPMINYLLDSITAKL